MVQKEKSEASMNQSALNRSKGYRINLDSQEFGAFKV